MKALVMDGIVLRREILAGIRDEITQAAAAGSPPPCLATVVVGDNPRCHILARGTRSAAAEVGMRTATVDLPGTATQDEVEKAVGGLGDDPGVHGIFVQLPLPGHLDLDALLALVPPVKDVDGMLPHRGHAPTSPLAVVRLLDRYDVAISGRRVVVVGDPRGMALLLGDKGGDVTQVDRASPEVCREADILVAAAGRPHTVGADHVRPGAAVVDVTGDVDLAAVEAVAGAVAPYPTAVGPVALACLLRNTLDAAKLGV